MATFPSGSSTKRCLLLELTTISVVLSLSISAAVKHYSPYIIQSKHTACILTDSKPCVQAYEKMCRGEFSTSMRVTTFLSTASRYQVSVRHLAGSSNIPSDFASRNAPECVQPKCQICEFVATTEDCVIQHVSTQDIASGSVRIPFTSRAAWRQTQKECEDLRRVSAHLSQGTRPSKKATTIKDVKRYLNIATIAKDGLLVVKRQVPMAPTMECIIVPRQVIHGLLTALHIKLAHPTAYQLKALTSRYFYALDMEKAIEQVTKACHQCASLQSVPHTTIDQSTSDPPEAVGTSYAADVLKRERQLIFIMRETVTCYTKACIIESESSSALRQALISLCVEMRPLDGPNAVIRVDPASGFKALLQDEQLRSHRITLEMGRIKNKNKNPVAERAVQELAGELLRYDPAGGPISNVGLSVALSQLNSRIRDRGLSAREMWNQRDQFTNKQLPINDRALILAQHDTRVKNHPHSVKSKAPQGQSPSSALVEVGDLVYLYADRNKSKARDRYLVVAVDGQWCNIRKFTGSQLRSMSYRVKLTECYKVPSDSTITDSRYRRYHTSDTDSDSEDGDVNLPSAPPKPPDIPCELTEPHSDIPSESVTLDEHNQSSHADSSFIPVVPPVTGQGSNNDMPGISPMEAESLVSTQEDSDPEGPVDMNNLHDIPWRSSRKRQKPDWYRPT